MSKLLESIYSLDSALTVTLNCYLVTVSVSILYRLYSIIAIGSWPSRSRPGLGLGLDFGLFNFKSNSLILDIAH